MTRANTGAPGADGGGGASPLAVPITTREFLTYAEEVEAGYRLYDGNGRLIGQVFIKHGDLDIDGVETHEVAGEVALLIVNAVNSNPALVAEVARLRGAVATMVDCPYRWQRVQVREALAAAASEAVADER